MASVEVLFLSRQDIETLDLSLDEILDAIEIGLKAHGEGQVIMPSKDHLPLDYPSKLFNILKGYVAPVSACGVSAPR
jgi:ornithine cyclodeaminase/alanine dehydrogenase-like protein (mu-crystallin family)